MNVADTDLHTDSIDGMSEGNTDAVTEQSPESPPVENNTVSDTSGTDSVPPDTASENAADSSPETGPETVPENEIQNNTETEQTGTENSDISAEAPQDSVGTDTSDGINSDLLTDIDMLLYQHKTNFEDVTTVSGNVISVMVTPDDSTSLLLQNIYSGQTASYELQNMTYSLLVCIFFVLVFDILHRFGKRIIKNMVKGGKENE